MIKTPLTKEDFERILANIEYKSKPTWKLIVRDLEQEHYVLQVEDKQGMDNFSDAPFPWRGRKWLLSVHMTVSEVVRTAYKAIQAAEEHEMAENFRYKGVALFDPHRNVDLLVKAGFNVTEGEYNVTIDSRDNRSVGI